MKTIRHKWQPVGFLHQRCEKCPCEKIRINGYTWYQVGNRTSIIDPGCLLPNDVRLKNNY